MKAWSGSARPVFPTSLIAEQLIPIEIRILEKVTSIFDVNDKTREQQTEARESSIEPTSQLLDDLRLILNQENEQNVADNSAESVDEDVDNGVESLNQFDDNAGNPTSEPIPATEESSEDGEVQNQPETPTNLVDRVLGLQNTESPAREGGQQNQKGLGPNIDDNPNAKNVRSQSLQDLAANLGWEIDENL